MIFEPHHAHVLLDAFSKICAAMAVSPLASSQRNAIAARIIELVERGEDDPDRLCERILREMRGTRREKIDF